ncbi:hypothetical protein [Jatrophihabitans endophyticus]|uniref:hypothetical protein n=1 Tax=Jatrophihabitans endophyticus TaxID=1206085 RepID=UPI0011610B34|nr:hypothetical protein [Jatrophihabitans endophyticus]
MTDVGTAPAADAPSSPSPATTAAAGRDLLAVAAVALVVGAGATAAAYGGATALLVAVVAVQTLFGLGWVLGTGMPGRRGGVVVGALAAAGADVAVSLYPQDRLGPLVAVLALAVPVAFVHQLLRGAARVQLVSSLSAVALLVLAQVSVSAWVQLRHEFTGSARLGTGIEGRVSAAVVGAAFAAVLVGCLVDVVVSVPRFDPAVPRGVLGLVAAAAVGAAAAYLALRDVRDFGDGRAVFLGAAVGALAGLLAIAATFVAHTTPRGTSWLARLGRPVYTALLPVCVLAPAAFLLCLAIRS